MKHRGAGLLLGAAIVFAGCADADAGTQPDVDAEAEAARSSAVLVRAEGCGPRAALGLGTVVTGGLIITAAHVVAGAELIEVTSSDGRSDAVAEVVLFDPQLDVAALRPDQSIGVATPLRAGPIGETAVVATRAGASSIELLDATVVRSVTVRTTDIYRDADVERPGFEIAASIEPGDSGTMVQFPGGAAGVVWAASTVTEGRAWAVSLPGALTAPEQREVLTDPVDTGACI